MNGYPTIVTTSSAGGGTKYRIPVNLGQIAAAQAAQGTFLGQTGTFRWGKVSNNCATHCRDVLIAGGQNIQEGEVFRLRELREWLEANAQR